MTSTDSILTTPKQGPSSEDIQKATEQLERELNSPEFAAAVKATATTPVETNAEAAARKLAEHTEDTAAAIAKATNRPTPKKKGTTKMSATTTKPKATTKPKPAAKPKATPKDDGKVAFNLSTSAYAVLMTPAFVKANPKIKAALLDSDKRRSAGGAKFPGYHHPRMSREDAAKVGAYLTAEATRLEKLPSKERGGNLTSIKRYAGLVTAIAKAK
jgi:hypothetical protein